MIPAGFTSLAVSSDFTGLSLCMNPEGQVFAWSQGELFRIHLQESDNSWSFMDTTGSENRDDWCCNEWSLRDAKQEYERQMHEHGVAVIHDPAVQQARSFANLVEDAVVGTLADKTAEHLLESIAPRIEALVIEKFGLMPQRIEYQPDPQVIRTFDGVFHPMFVKVLRLAEKREPVFMVGRAGTGKNHIAEQIADALELEFHFMNAITNEFGLIGFIDANGNYHDTPFYRAYKDGGVFLLDEYDASVPEVGIALNAAIANGYALFPTGRVQRNEDFVCLANGNTWGTGANAEFVGRYQQDAASLDRFMQVEIEYCRNVEIALARGKVEIVDFMEAFRVAMLSAGLRHVASMRATHRLAAFEGTPELEDTFLMKAAVTRGLDVDDLRILSGLVNEEVSENRWALALTELAA